MPFLIHANAIYAGYARVKNVEELSQIVLF